MISNTAFYCLHTVKWFQVLLFIACTQLNVYHILWLSIIYCLHSVKCLSHIAIYCLHSVKWFQVLFSNINSFSTWTQLNGLKYCYQTLIILFNIIYLWMIKEFYFTHRCNLISTITLGQSIPRSMAMKEYSTFPKVSSLEPSHQMI